MIVKGFHLLGRDPSTGDNVQSIEFDITQDLETVKTYVADSFGVVDPAGLGFQTPNSRSIPDFDTLLDTDGPIAVTIDGHPVREVPGPAGLPIVGNYYQVYPDHLGNNQRLFERYGPVIQHTDMGKQIYLTNDPKVAAQIFQESPFWSKRIEGNHPLLGGKDNDAGLFLGDTDSEHWRLAHKYFPQALSPKAVRHYTPMTQRTAESAFKIFDIFAEQNEAFNVFAYMYKLTSQAVAKLILNVDLHHFDTPDAPLADFIIDLMDFLELLRAVGEKASWYANLPFGAPKRLREKKASFTNASVVAMKKAQARGGPDLPMATAALEADSIADFAARAIDEDGNKIPEDAAVGAMPVLIGAGFTTTAALLSWMTYHIATQPAVQNKLLQELIDHGTTADTQWNYDTTNELHYLDNFIKETQRCTNPSFQPARTALRDQVIAGGFEIPKGSTMICALHALHRNPAIWDDPTKFDPDRWDTEKVKGRPHGSYIPFATGPRSCIGFNFALQEAKTMFATLLYRYEFRKYGDEHVDYDKGSIVIRPSNLFVRLRRRTTWPQKSK